MLHSFKHIQSTRDILVFRRFRSDSYGIWNFKCRLLINF